MLNINFSSDQNNSEYQVSVIEYSDIWLKDGELVVKTWEGVTGLRFEEGPINATVSNKISYSNPLNLRFNYSVNQKRSILIHELGHRILAGKVKGMRDSGHIVVHKVLDLVLWKVWKEIYGVEFMIEAIEFEKNLTENYKLAWDWALSFSEEERESLIKRVLVEDVSVITR